MIRKNKKVIITNNREIYNKFNMLHFSKEIVLRNVKQNQIDKIIKNINRDNMVLHVEKMGNYFLVRRNGPVDFRVYLK